MKEFINYAPYIIIAIVFLAQYRIFVTPTQLKEELEAREKACDKECKEQYVTKAEMQIERKNLMDDVRREFLEKVAFEQFNKRLDDKFDFIGKTMQTVIENQEHIKEWLISKK